VKAAPRAPSRVNKTFCRPAGVEGGAEAGRCCCHSKTPSMVKKPAIMAKDIIGPTHMYPLGAADAGGVTGGAAGGIGAACGGATGDWLSVTLSLG